MYGVVHTKSYIVLGHWYVADVLQVMKQPKKCLDKIGEYSTRKWGSAKSGHCQTAAWPSLCLEHSLDGRVLWWQ